MKILNLYAGIGGNRKLWGGEHQVTAVEFDSEIAKAYKDRFPDDIVIVGDAMKYLLEHYKEFDFIWASPPCQSHSTIINSQYTRESYKAKFPDMSLYQIILFLKFHIKSGKFVVENVKPYYKPLIQPNATIDRHHYWSNFDIKEIEVKKEYIIKFVKISTLTDFDISIYKGIKNKRQVIRNQVNYNIGKHILEQAVKQTSKASA
ncbi:MAG: DNA cytosine methyltransferase [Campylobacterales bacterium]|nr:DNA cytosine methyltransferase [Campylobacterales bacterium]